MHSFIRGFIQIGLATLFCGGLVACNNDHLQTKIDNESDPAFNKPLDQMPITYQTFLKRILRPRCLSCHNEKNKTDAARTLFYPFEKIKPVFLKKPGRENKLYKAVTSHEEDEQMPPPDSEIAPLTQSEVDFIANWIDLGAPLK